MNLYASGTNINSQHAAGPHDAADTTLPSTYLLLHFGCPFCIQLTAALHQQLHWLFLAALALRTSTMACTGGSLRASIATLMVCSRIWNRGPWPLLRFDVHWGP